MPSDARKEILSRLRSAPRRGVPPRPALPPLPDLSFDRERMIDKFSSDLTALAGSVHRVRSRPEALDRLTEVAREEDLTRVVVSSDPLIASLDLADWGRRTGIRVFSAADYGDRDSFRRAVFDEAQAGITGADYALSESGTLVLAHRRDQARLISLAPILHIALVPVESVRPVYESVTREVFEGREPVPSQLTFITGPSLTGDIRGIPFRGMHGPRRVIAILIGA
jgi:L-lactate dehydrogenase complex protein LldG